MSHKYATVTETIADVLSEVKEDDTAAVESIGRLIEAASAFIDQYCKRPDAYFMPVDPVDPGDDPPVYPTSVRRYAGTGQNFIQVGRFIPGTVSIANFAVGTYYENQQRGSFIFAKSPAGSAGYDDDLSNVSFNSKMFQAGATYEVTAAWGFAATPAPIVMATKQIVQQIWDRGKGIIGQLSPTGFVIERDIPLTAATFLNQYIKREFEIN